MRGRHLTRIVYKQILARIEYFKVGFSMLFGQPRERETPV
jgi:hypothetical protein